MDDELARIEDAVAGLDALLVPYSVQVTLADASNSAQANVIINTDFTSASGSAADGVLGSESDAGKITILQGWDWYAGADPSAIAAGQYDFQTVVTHELGHALGLGHNPDDTSVMHATLPTGTVHRAVVVADLNIPDVDGGGAHPLRAAGFPALPVLHVSLPGSPAGGGPATPALASLPGRAGSSFAQPFAGYDATLLTLATHAWPLEPWALEVPLFTPGADAALYIGRRGSLVLTVGLGSDVVPDGQVPAAKPNDSALRHILEEWAGAASAMPGESEPGSLLGPFDLPYQDRDVPDSAPANDPDDLDQEVFLRDSYFADFYTEGGGEG